MGLVRRCCGLVLLCALLVPPGLLLLSIPLQIDLLRSQDASFLRRWVKSVEGKDVPLPDGMLLGVATAPAHVEDQLNDAWLTHARKGKVAAFHNAVAPEERLMFWSEPEVELDLAQQSGSDVFRLGIDWARTFPEAPENMTQARIDSVLGRYREILEMVHARGMKIMVTLFHHSLPEWSAELGGWTAKRTIDDFVQFGTMVMTSMGDLVEFWTIFNEPHIYAMLTHCAGIWPPGFEPGPADMVQCIAPGGTYETILRNMADAHGQLYHILVQDALRKGVKRAAVGAAHHVSIPTAHSPEDTPGSLMMHMYSTFFFPDLVKDSVDFLGVNYYGQEILHAGDVLIAPTEEYSEAGRAVYPNGLFHALVSFHRRYQVPLWVTENGVADSVDNLRQNYLQEHLLAVTAAAKRGARIDGYIFWTISDNWEWADGYCPKFGMVAVERKESNGTVSLPRTKRPSFEIFKQIANDKIVRAETRKQTWRNLMEKAAAGEKRPVCRNLESTGPGSGSEGTDEPSLREWNTRDWRLGHYEESILPFHYVPAYLEPVITHVTQAWAMLRNAFGDYRKDQALAGDEATVAEL